MIFSSELLKLDKELQDFKVEGAEFHKRMVLG